MAFNQLVAGSTPAGLTKIIAEYRHYKLYLKVLPINILKVSAKLIDNRRIKFNVRKLPNFIKFFNSFIRHYFII